MKQRRHLIVVAIWIVILLSVFASSAYIMCNAAHHHECIGENCPICQFIAQVEQLHRGFGMALLALLLICIVLAMRHEMHAPAMTDVPTFCTLIRRKVRFND